MEASGRAEQGSVVASSCLWGAVWLVQTALCGGSQGREGLGVPVTMSICMCTVTVSVCLRDIMRVCTPV